MHLRLPAAGRGVRGIASVLAPVVVGACLAYAWTAADSHIDAWRSSAVYARQRAASASAGRILIHGRLAGGAGPGAVG